MDNQLACPLCTMQFSQQKLPRLLTMCGHTFCQECILAIIAPIAQNKYKVLCPQDGSSCQIAQININNFPKNLALLKVIDSNKSKSSFKDSSFDVSRIAKEQQVQQDQDTKQLITAIRQSQHQSLQVINKQSESKEISKQTSKQEQEIQDQQKQQNKQQLKQQNREEQQDRYQEQQQQQEQNVCLLHQKPLQIVCVVDLQKICAKCAIFGQHKGHQFKSIQQIQQQNQNFNIQLLAVYHQKQQILNRISNKITKSDLLSIVSANKDNLLKQIKQRFKKLTDAIKSQEKKAFTKLQKIFQKTQKDIQDLYKIQPQTIQKYQEWQKLSFQKLKISEKGQFQQKLKLLLIDQANKQKNTIWEGKKIVQQIKFQQDNIINKAELFLNNINLKTDDRIFQFIDTFVQIFDKPQSIIKEQNMINTESPPKNKVINIRQKTQKSTDKKSIQEDLLYTDQHHDMIYEQQKIQRSMKQINYSKNLQNIKIQDVCFIPALQSKTAFKEFNNKEQLNLNLNFHQTSNKMLPNVQKNYQISHNNTSRDSSFVSQKCIKPPKKKLKSIKVSQKYQKILESLYADTIDTLDLTNAQLGDSTILQICQFIPGTKIKTIKFIRNKLSDDVLSKMIPLVSNCITLNLSQNNLTQRALDIFIQYRQMLPKVKSIILSMNKIIERKHKKLIDQLRKLDVTVSV